MKRRSFIAGLALAVTCITASLFAAPPHAFNRRHVPPGWAVCNKCNGAGCVVRNWLGITKRCEKCNGLGVRRIVRNMPPPPPRVIRPEPKHHPKPKMKAPPRPHVKHPPKKASPKPAPDKGGRPPAKPQGGKHRR